MKNIILYSTKDCPKCSILKEKLAAANITYTEENDIEKMRAIGMKMVPALEVGMELMCFTKAIKWIEENKKI